MSLSVVNDCSFLASSVSGIGRQTEMAGKTLTASVVGREAVVCVN